jgi:5'-nucleotidase
MILKYTSLLVALCGLITLVGCQNKKAKTADAPALTNDVLAVEPTSYDAAPIPSIEPVAAPAPVMASATTPAPSAGPAASSGSNYQVKKGDTLFGIARTHYGDGKQWQRIANANPGLTPANLKAGSMIAIP